jgi:hypothetical protein
MGILEICVKATTAGNLQRICAGRAGTSRLGTRDLAVRSHKASTTTFIVTATQLRLAFETAGVAFIEMEGIGPGVCIRQRDAEAATRRQEPAAPAFPDTGTGQRRIRRPNTKCG